MDVLTLNFARHEFACPHCSTRPLVDQHLVQVLQRARTVKGKPLRVVSGWRCPTYNARVGGHPRSQHLYGRAADVVRGYATPAEWHSYGAVGLGLRDGQVIHVDVTPGRRPFTFLD